MSEHQIERDSLVTIDYSLCDAETGTDIDASAPGEPLAYVHGRGQLLPGLEKALEQRTVGDELDITVPAADGYGDHDPEMVMKVPRSQFAFDVQVGGVVKAQAPDGRSHHLMIVDVQDDEVTVDGNHPLAGRSLHFEVTVEGVRQATPEEIAEAMG